MMKIYLLLVCACGANGRVLLEGQQLDQRFSKMDKMLSRGYPLPPTGLSKALVLAAELEAASSDDDNLKAVVPASSGLEKKDDKFFWFILIPLGIILLGKVVQTVAHALQWYSESNGMKKLDEKKADMCRHQNKRKSYLLFEMLVKQKVLVNWQNSNSNGLDERQRAHLHNGIREQGHLLSESLSDGGFCRPDGYSINRFPMHERVKDQTRDAAIGVVKAAVATALAPVGGVAAMAATQASELAAHQMMSGNHDANEDLAEKVLDKFKTSIELGENAAHQAAHHGSRIATTSAHTLVSAMKAAVAGVTILQALGEIQKTVYVVFQTISAMKDIKRVSHDAEKDLMFADCRSKAQLVVALESGMEQYFKSLEKLGISKDNVDSAMKISQTECREALRQSLLGDQNVCSHGDMHVSELLMKGYNQATLDLVVSCGVYPEEYHESGICVSNVEWYTKFKGQRRDARSDTGIIDWAGMMNHRGNIKQGCHGWDEDDVQMMKLSKIWPKGTALEHLDNCVTDVWPWTEGGGPTVAEMKEQLFSGGLFQIGSQAGNTMDLNKGDAWCSTNAKSVQPLHRLAKVLWGARNGERTYGSPVRDLIVLDERSPVPEWTPRVEAREVVDALVRGARYTNSWLGVFHEERANIPGITSYGYTTIKTDLNGGCNGGCKTKFLHYYKAGAEVALSGRSISRMALAWCQTYYVSGWPNLQQGDGNLKSKDVEDYMKRVCDKIYCLTDILHFDSGSARNPVPTSSWFSHPDIVGPDAGSLCRNGFDKENSRNQDWEDLNGKELLSQFLPHTPTDVRFVIDQYSAPHTNHPETANPVVEDGWQETDLDWWQETDLDEQHLGKPALTKPPPTGDDEYFHVSAGWGNPRQETDH